MSTNDTTRLKLTLTTKESDGEIPLLSDLTAEGDLDNGYPTAFQIPYQYAVGVLKETAEESSSTMKFLQPLKTNPDPFYHNGCSFSTVADSFNALRTYAQMHLETTSPDIRDVLRIGKVYEVSLVFRAVGSNTVRDLHTKELVEYVRIKLKQACITDDELKEFVRAEYQRLMNELTVEPDDPLSVIPENLGVLKKPITIDPYPVQPTPRDADQMDQALGDKSFIHHLMTSKTKGDKQFVEKFFDILDFYESCPEDARINVKLKKTQNKILDWYLSRLFSNEKEWVECKLEMIETFSLSVSGQNQLLALPYAYVTVATVMAIMARTKDPIWTDRKPALTVKTIKKNKKPS